VSFWDENAGRVTRSFNDWYLVDRDQRAFLRKGLEFSKEVYDRIWNELAEQPGDPDAPELPDLFNDAVNGLWSHDFDWMHLSGVIKDAVTNFEVYLEHAADEVLAFHDKRYANRKRSAPWARLVAFYKVLDIDVASGPVLEIRDLRHILTHRRGELRTEEQRDRFGSDEPFMDSVAHLDVSDVESRMDVLADAVRVVDPVAYDHTWGRVRSAAILALDDDPLTPARRRRASARACTMGE
jgi:hypothetical protein